MVIMDAAGGRGRPRRRGLSREIRPRGSLEAPTISHFAGALAPTAARGRHRSSITHLFWRPACPPTRRVVV